jgi:hypothetical protein
MAIPSKTYGVECFFIDSFETYKKCIFDSISSKSMSSSFIKRALSLATPEYSASPNALKNFFDYI